MIKTIITFLVLATLTYGLLFVHDGLNVFRILIAAGILFVVWVLIPKAKTPSAPAPKETPPPEPPKDIRSVEDKIEALLNENKK